MTTTAARYCPTVGIPATIVEKHPNCFALIADVAGRMAVVDPDVEPKADGKDVAYLIIGRHTYISRYIRCMGQIVLTNHGQTYPEKNVEIVGSVVWFNAAHEKFRSRIKE